MAASVLVTRPVAGDALADRLVAEGFRVHRVATIAIATLAEPEGAALDDAIESIADFDWVVVTSAAGAKAVAARIAARVTTSGSPQGSGPRWAAVGPATARALRTAGLPVDLVAATATGAGLAEALREAGPLVGSRILLPRASGAASDLPEALRAANAEVREVVAYRTVEGPADSRAAAMADRLRSIPIVSIGPSTTAAARAIRLSVAAEAAEPSTAGLVTAVLSVVAARSIA